MMPASNQGVGENIGFPDVCLTPAAPSPVPIPYPNLGSNAMGLPFTPTIMLSMMPGHNQSAKPMMTNGDNGGVSHAMFMQSGGNNLGNPRILLSGMPAETLCNPTQGNNYNCPLDAKLVPSVTNVLMSYLPSGDARALAAELRGQGPAGLGLTSVREADGRLRVVHVRRGGPGARAGLVAGDRIALGAAEPAGAVVVRRWRGGEAASRRVAPGSAAPTLSARLTPDGLGVLVLRRCALDAPAALDQALAGLAQRGARGLVLDLRGNPGGDLGVARALAARFLPADRLGLPRGAVPCALPLLLWVDGGTASAAEVLAHLLVEAGRARAMGAPTWGKLQAWPARLVGERLELAPGPLALRRPDGRALTRLEPELEPGPAPLERARRLLAGGAA